MQNLIVKFNNYVWGAADNIKRDQRILDDQRGRRHALILTQFVQKFAQELYNQFFIKHCQYFTKSSHSISLYIRKYKSHRWFLFQLPQSLKIVYYSNIHTSCQTCKCQSRDLWLNLNEISLISCLKIINIQTLWPVCEVEIMYIYYLTCILLLQGVKVFPQIRLGILIVQL